MRHRDGTPVCQECMELFLDQRLSRCPKHAERLVVKNKQPVRFEYDDKVLEVRLVSRRGHRGPGGQPCA